MNVLDAKVINTKYGLETYLDIIKNIEIHEIHTPTTNKPYYEVMIGLEYFLLKKEKYYQSVKNYFCIQMSSDFHSITLKEPNTESLFAVKTEDEREATKELVAEWLIKTHAYQQAINEEIQKQKTKNVRTEEEIQNVLGAIKFLEKLLHLKTEDIQNASVEK